jgi:hypothetical protein
MPGITTARFMRSTNYQNDAYFVFENIADNAVKLCKITRAQLDNLVSQRQQQNIITTATTILPKSGYNNGSINAMKLFADPGTGAVRLYIGTRDSQGFKVYMGRIESGNWVACANTPIPIDSRVATIEHASGNSNEANAITSDNGTLYLEGH